MRVYVMEQFRLKFNPKFGTVQMRPFFQLKYFRSSRLILIFFMATKLKIGAT
jgi:hypothetical protein